MTTDPKRAEEEADRELLSDLYSATTDYADARVAEAAAVARRERAESKLSALHARIGHRLTKSRST